MVEGFDSWESYFYPETFDPATGAGTLRNKFGQRDGAVLAELEYGRTTGRAQQIRTGRVEIPRTFDGEHLQAIHRHLFQDVYEWAGEFRTVNMSKGAGRPFGDVEGGEVDRYLAEVHTLATGVDWASLDRPDFVARAATTFAYVNQAHPFREGNGRTSKVFMHHLAEGSAFAFEFRAVSPDVWNQGSAMSGPDLFGFAPDPTSLVPVFHAVTVDRPASAAADDLADVRGVVRAPYLRPAREAPRGSGQEPPQARRGGPAPTSDLRPSVGLD